MRVQSGEALCANVGLRHGHATHMISCMLTMRHMHSQACNSAERPLQITASCHLQKPPRRMAKGVCASDVLQQSNTDLPSAVRPCLRHLLPSHTDSSSQQVGDAPASAPRCNAYRSDCCGTIVTATNNNQIQPHLIAKLHHPRDQCAADAVTQPMATKQLQLALYRTTMQCCTAANPRHARVSCTTRRLPPLLAPGATLQRCTCRAVRSTPAEQKLMALHAFACFGGQANKLTRSHPHRRQAAPHKHYGPLLATLAHRRNAARAAQCSQHMLTQPSATAFQFSLPTTTTTKTKGKRTWTAARPRRTSITASCSPPLLVTAALPICRVISGLSPPAATPAGILRLYSMLTSTSAPAWVDNVRSVAQLSICVRCKRC